MNSIRFRLLLWLMIPLTIVAAIVAIETFLSSSKTSNDLHDKTLLTASLAISENIIASNGNLLAEETLEVLTDTLGDRYFYHVAGPSNSFATGYSGYPRLPTNVTLEDNMPHFYDGEHLGNPVRVMAFRQLLIGREINGLTTITTWQRITQRDKLTFELFSRSILRLLLLVLAAGFIVWLALSKGLKPLLNLQSAIESRSPYDLTPIKRNLPIELTGIVSSMNELFGRVALSKSNRERFIGDAAHQLRNPIAAIKTQAETALVSKNKEGQKKGLENIIETTNHTSKLVKQMLSSASAYAMDVESGSEIELNELVAEAAREMAPKALEKNQEFSFEENDKKEIVHGRKILLREAVLNLLDNAIKYSPADTQISVRLMNAHEEGFVAISISDQGKPISEAQLIELSQPFSTGDANNSGTGLGLSVAKDIAKSHGGWLSVSKNTNDTSGLGKQVLIILPRYDGS